VDRPAFNLEHPWDEDISEVLAATNSNPQSSTPRSGTIGAEITSPNCKRWTRSSMPRIQKRPASKRATRRARSQRFGGLGETVLREHVDVHTATASRPIRSPRRNICAGTISPCVGLAPIAALIARRFTEHWAPKPNAFGTAATTASNGVGHPADLRPRS